MYSMEKFMRAVGSVRVESGALRVIDHWRMDVSSFQLQQVPSAGDYRKFYAGDVLHLELRVQGGAEGIGAVRTNLGRRALHLARVAQERERGYEGRCSAEEWHDVPMRSLGHGRFVCDLPLPEVGTFMAKCTFQERAGGERHWVSGDNLRIRVEPAQTVSCNTIYNAFVRQFGPNRSGGWLTPELKSGEGALDAAGYTVLPPSGHFRDLRREIPFIMDQLGFRVIQLLPIQPTPTSYGRMGRYGSPFAPTDYFGIDPALAEFDRRSTPLDQFRELVDCIHAHDGLVLLDLPIDHTGWASRLQQEHPDWFCRDKDGSFASPGAWGVVWEDLCKLDFSHRELWDYLAEVFLHWVRNGVDGFRCDAGYMIPRPVWRHIISRVRIDYPDVVFFLEGLGGTVACTHDLLENGGMNWAYTELFQVVGEQWVKEYLGMLFSGVSERGGWVNFAETHDNNRLAATSRRWAEMRTALAALTSDHGAFGVANGVEWLATEKIDVHGAGSLNWGASENLVGYLGSLNRILRWHPAFGRGSSCRLVGTGNAVGVLRGTGGQRVLAIFNVDEQSPATLRWTESEFGISEHTVDLLTGIRPSSITLQHGHVALTLRPGESVCLGEHDLPWWQSQSEDGNARQCLASAALKAWVFLHGYGDLADCDASALASALRQGGRVLVSQLTGGGYAPVVTWHPDRDEHRVVLLPAGHFLSIRCGHSFRASLERAGHPRGMVPSFRCSDGSHEVLLCGPRSVSQSQEDWLVRLEEFDGDRVLRREGRLLALSGSGNPLVPLRVGKESLTSHVTGICTNEFGGYALVRGRWGELQSKYDGLLAAGLSRECPIDRRLVLSRCRGWLVYRDASVELAPECQDWFGSGYDGVMGWGFTVPMGFTTVVRLEVTYEFARGRNGGRLVFHRHEDGHPVPEDEPLYLILRPDVDWRVNHEETKAYAGAEQEFPRSVTVSGGGFRFAPYGSAGMWMRSDQGSFQRAGEWHYQVALPEDASRGLPGECDIFSPGYFRFDLKPGAVCTVEVGIGGEAWVEEPRRVPVTADSFAPLPLGDCLRRSLELYVARRDENKTVIAGYPWFLDWGRDTLICLRGLVAAGDLDGSRDIIRAFASFEDRGTIPNMIRGRDSGDRATSDAPLWLLIAAEDLVQASGEAGEAVLEMDCGGRSLRSILESVVRHYGTEVPNGVQADPETGLVFSPSHYTWMDTNYPAGTPREGYPVEIQAMWIHGLSFVARITGDSRYESWRQRAEASFLELFVRDDGRGLVDCLHGRRGQGARHCQADDAIRPNQLLAVTLCDFLPCVVVESVLSVCSGLVMPGGIRSLGDEVVRRELRVVRDGVLLNDPHHPYQGHYVGDEDTRRKAAYHNGTGWGWQFPLYCEALFRHWGAGGRSAARSLLASVVVPMRSNCVGHIPEIYDGDAPHECRGCPAQAWSMYESYRVWRLLNGD